MYVYGRAEWAMASIGGRFMIVMVSINAHNCLLYGILQVENIA